MVKRFHNSRLMNVLFLFFPPFCSAFQVNGINDPNPAQMAKICYLISFEAVFLFCSGSPLCRMYSLNTTKLDQQLIYSAPALAPTRVNSRPLVHKDMMDHVPSRERKHSFILFIYLFSLYYIHVPHSQPQWL
jgi:hypothetical protein